MEFTEMDKTIVISALEIKLGSLKRGMNTAKSPNFKQVYDLEITETNKTLAKIQAIQPAKPAK